MSQVLYLTVHSNVSRQAATVHVTGYRGGDAYRQSLLQCVTLSFLPLMSPVFIAYTTNLNIQQFYVPPKLFLCLLCGSENKQRFFSLYSIN
jgi:hypothetical protein